MRSVPPQGLREALQGVDPPLLLDVREPWEADIVRLPGSHLLPMSRLHPGVVDELPRERDVVVICHHGIRSAQVARWLENAGLQRVINLTGGIDAWAREVDPDLPVY